ncbi:MAG: hypothetical protein ACRDKI_09285 [Solirubrobacterales bacterium]
MLAVKKYKPDYVEDCRGKIKKHSSAYKKFVKNTGAGSSATSAFEPYFFNNLVIVMDSFFIHRMRGMEGKDGNPLNEVRMLSASLMDNDGKLAADSSIKYDVVSSVLKYEVGDTIKLSASDFSKLSKAFFAELENRYA